MEHKGRKLTSWLLTLALLLVLAPVLAGNAKAEGEVTTAGALQTALSASGEATVTLGADIETNSTLTVHGTKTLDLNGYGIRYNGSDTTNVIYVLNDGTLNLIDSGTTTNHSYTVTDGLATVDASYSTDEGHISFTGGYITGGKGYYTNSTYYGGGIFVQGGTFNMSGGTIIGNTAYRGGGVYVGYLNHSPGGTFIMTGGTITGNTATDNGGGVFVYKNGEFHISSAPVITSNRKVTGENATNNVFLQKDYSNPRYITVTGQLTGSEESIGVTQDPSAATPVAFAKAGSGYNGGRLTYDDVAKFSSDNTAYEVIKNNNSEAVLDAAATHISMINGVLCKNGEPCTEPLTLSTGTYRLFSDIIATAQIHAENNAVITLDLNGYGILYQGAGQCISFYYAELTLQDSNPDMPHTIYLDNKRGVGVTSGGTTIGDTSSTSIAITGGFITGGYGGVYVEQGTFTMSGGTITGNTDTGGNGGGGVYVRDGSFTMSGGEITGNTTTNKGGGLYIKSCEFTMSGGEITGNTAQRGGGVCLDDGTFAMSGGEITGNTATGVGGVTGDGGGLYMYYKGTFEMTGGEITGNTAESGKGGGVYVDDYYNAYEKIVKVSETPVITGNHEGTGDDATDSNVYLKAANCKIEVTNELSNGARIGVMPDSSIVESKAPFITGLNIGGANASKCFTSDKGTYAFSLNSDGDMIARELVSVSLECSPKDGGALKVMLEGTAVENGGKVDKGSELTVTATANGGYDLGKLTCRVGDGQETEIKSGDTVTAADNIVIKATFTRKPDSTGRHDSGDTPPFTQQLPATQSFDGGKIAISPANAKEGDTVTITVTPEAGQRLASLTVKRVNGTVPIPAVDKGNGVFEFTMPSVQVAVEAKFEPIETQPQQPAPGAAQVVLSPQRITVNGAEASVEAYNINGTNFFKLRDLAALLKGTPAQFNVEYDEARNAVVITTGAAYAGAVGTGFTDMSAEAVVSPQTVFVNGASVSLTAYNIGGYNFFGLRELAQYIGYGVAYDEASNTAIIESK